MKTIKTLVLIVIGIVLLILGLIFSLANMTPVTLKFYHFETIAMPLWFLVIMSVLLGAVFTIVLIVLDLYRGSRKLSRVKRELKSLESKYSSLKNDKERIERDKAELQKSMTTKPKETTENKEINDEPFSPTSP